MNSLSCLLFAVVAAYCSMLEADNKPQASTIYPQGYFEQCQLLKYFLVIPESPLSTQQLRIDDDRWLTTDYEISLGKNFTPGFNLYKKSKTHTATYTLFKHLYAKNHPAVVKPSTQFIIPPIIHQIWLGGTPPPAFAQLQKTILDNHPGWLYKLWTDHDVKKLNLVNKRYINKAHNPAEKADMLRYELLNIFGGWYFDWDIQACRSFEPLGKRYEFCTGIPGVGKQVYACNSVIGSRPHHPILQKTIETIRDYRKEKGISQRTGPIHFTRSLKEAIPTYTHRTIVLPTQFCYPPLPSPAYLISKDQTTDAIKPEIISIIKPETFAIHYWAASWVEKK